MICTLCGRSGHHLAKDCPWQPNKAHRATIFWMCGPVGFLRFSQPTRLPVSWRGAGKMPVATMRSMVGTDRLTKAAVFSRSR